MSATEEHKLQLIGENPLFYQTFLNLLNSTEEIDIETQHLVCTAGFTNVLKDANAKGGLTYEIVKEMAPYMKRMLCKPQSLMVDTDDYYIAEDELLSFTYICYRWLLMLDFDWPDLSPQARKEKLMETLEMLPSEIHGTKTFYYVLASRNGYHIFLLSHKMEMGSKQAIDLMLCVKSDPYYVVLSYLRGWSVRLSRKSGEENVVSLYKYVCAYGTGSPIDHCMVAMDIHLKLTGYYDTPDISEEQIRKQKPYSQEV